MSNILNLLHIMWYYYNTMKVKKMNNILNAALSELDSELTKRNIHVEIIICGAYALHLFGYARSEHTLDIDTITQLPSTSEFRNIVSSVGKKFGLNSNWLSDQASTVSLPSGIESRASPINKWKSINASLVSRDDLIKMKASAFTIRRDYTNKDWEDLLLLKPTIKEINDAIVFIKKVNSPPKNASRQILIEFEETINDLKKIIK